mmetsp:Transcript_35801/g.93936  ORF Transcript_35801/g.93936 Transcript_35801/m.93936 type:complete len:94 (+) Transcript_35801:417-698(+)
MIRFEHMALTSPQGLLDQVMYSFIPSFIPAGPAGHGDEHVHIHTAVFCLLDRVQCENEHRHFFCSLNAVYILHAPCDARWLWCRRATRACWTW